MHLTEREWWTLIHGMILGALFLLAFSGGLAGLFSLRPDYLTPEGLRERVRRLKVGISAMAIVAWLTVITGTWIVYPWYREKSPDSAKSQLLANPNTADWHEFGMEWKEHIAWIAPMLATTAVLASVQVVRMPRISVPTPTARMAAAAGPEGGSASVTSGARSVCSIVVIASLLFDRGDLRDQRPVKAGDTCCEEGSHEDRHHDESEIPVTRQHCAVVDRQKRRGFADALQWNDRVGPLSGKTIISVIAYFGSWGVLYLIWRRSNPPLQRIVWITVALIALGLIGTFPTFFQQFA